MTLMPNGVAPGSSSMTMRTCFSDWLNGRVVPVIIASASPSASIAAAKVVAVLVDHPLDLAAQHAVALVLLVDEVDRAADERRIAAVENLIVLRILDPELLQHVVDFLAPDQHRRAVAGLLEGDRGAQHVGLLAFREQHALRVRRAPLHRRGSSPRRSG